MVTARKGPGGEEPGERTIERAGRGSFKEARAFADAGRKKRKDASRSERTASKKVGKRGKEGGHSPGFVESYVQMVPRICAPKPTCKKGSGRAIKNTWSGQVKVGCKKKGWTHLGGKN